MAMIQRGYRERKMRGREEKGDKETSKVPRGNERRGVDHNELPHGRGQSRKRESVCG